MILLVSGGMDSIAAWRLLDCPRAVYFPLRTEAQQRELEALNWAHRERWATRSIEVGHKVNMGEREGLNGYVPYRNLILVALAAQMDAHVVVPMIAEWAPDKNRRFFKRLAKLLTEAGKGSFQGIDQQARIETPFAALTKAQLLKRYADEFGNGAALSICWHTWSCYHAGELHCGRCSGCVQRYVAEHATFGGALTRYETHPDPEAFYKGASLTDAYRWFRGNGHSSLLGMARRALEARRASVTTPADAPVARNGRSD